MPMLDLEIRICHQTVADANRHAIEVQRKVSIDQQLVRENLEKSIARIERAHEILSRER
jgi:hypothetical protein